MAKAKKSGMMDKLPNRKYVTVTWAAASTTAVFTQFDTMMGARDGAGWLISRVDLNWKGLPPDPGATASGTGTRAQLCTGAQTDILNADDDEVIANIDWQENFSAGGFSMVFPSWVGPVMVASRELTCCLKGTSTGAPYITNAMIFTIWYNWVKIGPRDWVEIAEARGIA